MLVYGDRADTIEPAQLIAAIEGELSAAGRAPQEPLDDHLRSVLIMAGALAQGLLDARFEAQGQDDPSDVGEAAMALVLASARKLAAVWGSPAAGPDVRSALRALRRLQLPERITCKQPEGYAYYGLFPEAYIAAAARRAWPAPPLVIGLRSIGVGLAGAVAAGCGSGAVITLRPHGHPFRRQISPSDALIRQIRAHRGPYAIVDEGPGLSGSSFGAVADLLEDLGVEPERMVFMPSHEGDLGPEADPRHRLRWARSERLTIPFEELWREAPPASWFADITGEPLRVDDLSGGAWRRAGGGLVQPQWERRKYRIIARSGVYLAKFAGLGPEGRRKFDRAQQLHQAGFCAAPLELRRGFILQAWIEGRPPDLFGPERQEFLRRVGDYLGFRAAAFKAGGGSGASPAALVEMVRVNGEAVLPGRGDRLADIAARLHAAELSPVQIDARLQPWEWVRAEDGKILKTDALDHCCAHDLVGCQDIAWDVAGAIVEYGLDAQEAARLTAAVEAASGRAVPVELLDAFEVSYAAFQAGAWSLAGEAPSSNLKYAAHLAKWAK